MRIAALSALSLVLFFSIASAAPEIRYEGSSTVGLFMKDAAKVYKKAFFDISVLTESNGGEICVLAKTCAIGGVAREIDPLFSRRGLVAIPFAYDVLTAIVNSENNVKELTSRQVGDIFSGKIKNWKEVGGEDIPIKVYIVGKESATYDVFKTHILKDAQYSPDAETVRPDWRTVLMVTVEKGGIAQISRAFAASTDQVRPLIIDGHNPKNYKPNYPLSRLLYLTTFGPPQGDVKEFIEWATSGKAEALLKKRFIPLNQ
ncbi:Phosphate ABC transporter, periplasmic phosphate-binding protein PstS (TC 3.A.1.7.1) [hydrothermal vent metagenome]|uniref:Phosphate ABC transporter, periplasmic phosphate-binding protein PstS (TC 3.A.1.7.1) n=1 Tax=hydrothermal vent metagenome TaxID=652676 RepID=A0A3B1CMJ9_9ZZZZ